MYIRRLKSLNIDLLAMNHNNEDEHKAIESEQNIYAVESRIDYSKCGMLVLQQTKYCKHRIQNICEEKKIMEITVKILFTDSDINYDTNAIGYAITTSFTEKKLPNLKEFMHLIDAQFKPLQQHLLNGYDVVVPLSRCEHFKYDVSSLSLPQKYNEYIQHKINELKYYAKTETIVAMYKNFSAACPVSRSSTCPASVMCAGCHQEKQAKYCNTLMVDKSLVLIIGINQFDEDKPFLNNVKQNVADLVNLWRDKYKYDVYVCNNDTLYSTKQDIVNFIAHYKTKLKDTTYKSVIVHIISHNNRAGFGTSNGEIINVKFIKNELMAAAKKYQQWSLVHLIFVHGVQGDSNYYFANDPVIDPRYVTLEKETHKKKGSFHIFKQKPKKLDSDSMSFESNFVVITGFIDDVVQIDSGVFTKYICHQFNNNLERMMKADFTSLMTELGRNLELDTNYAESLNINHTLRFDQIIFKKGNEHKPEYAKLESGRVKERYSNTFIVDKALVLIIGISNFDDQMYNIPGVKQNVADLVNLWRYKYKYDVYVCNNETLYSTKLDVIKFIDQYTQKLSDTTYKSVIVHIISHLCGDEFLGSDNKSIKIGLIKHELIS
eukprot:419274_1